jgi:transcriptional adapter 2-alpha
LDGPIFTYDWSAAEELLLLEGIDKHGVGNWKVIADYMSTMKTTSQIESHYWEIYMGRHGYCLPEYTLDNGVHVRTETLLPDGDAKQGMLTKLISDHTLGEEVVRDKGKDQSFKDTVVRGGREKVQEAQIRERIAQMPGAELPGYMPLRGDFDYEYENDGEVLLADMEFDDNDHPSERELKLQVVRIYNKKLDERDSRKKFVIERGIVDFKQQQGVSTWIVYSI